MYKKPTITPTTEPTAAPTIEPTKLATPTATVSTVTPTIEATAMPTPMPTMAPTAWPSSAPSYTFSCTFTGLVLNSTSTIITGISGNLTNIYTGDTIPGSINSDTYQFPHLPAGSYELVVDVQYTVYYSNDTASDRSTRITDSFDINGNYDKIYPLY